mmetsp:Transcript_46775/g.110132  ORF Transcript_46775/g.110132 Transcript_46775/m.110132 type:complete len:239 (-) Transcript_46775:4-720(-)
MLPGDETAVLFVIDKAHKVCRRWVDPRLVETRMTPHAHPHFELVRHHLAKSSRDEIPFVEHQVQLLPRSRFLARCSGEGCSDASHAVCVCRRELEHARTDEADAVTVHCKFATFGAHRQDRLSCARRVRWTGGTDVGAVRVRPIAAAQPSLRAGAAEHVGLVGSGVGPGAQTPIKRCGVGEHILHLGHRPRVPSRDVDVEGGRAGEHVRHVGYSRDVPTADVPIERGPLEHPVHAVYS